ncbi:hypothetical protein BH11ACT8_BH11ACT8_07840 [soil metagenome]
MDVEMSVTNAAAKARVLAALQARDLQAVPGPVRLAYPFTVLVAGVATDAVAEVAALVSEVDPGAGRVVTHPTSVA